jgi:hypothetical protein
VCIDRRDAKQSCRAMTTRDKGNPNSLIQSGTRHSFPSPCTSDTIPVPFAVSRIMSCNVFAALTQNCSGSGRSENSKHEQQDLQLYHMLTSLLFMYRVLSDIDSLEEEKRVIQKVQLSDHTKLLRSCADFTVLLP